MAFKSKAEATLHMRNHRRVEIQVDEVLTKPGGSLKIKAHAVNPPLREDYDLIRAVMELGVRLYKAQFPNHPWPDGKDR